MTNRLILPNGNGSHRSLKRDGDFLTVGQAKAMLVELYGPLASFVKQMDLRVRTLEGLPLDDSEPETQQASSGDVE